MRFWDSHFALHLRRLATSGVLPESVLLEGDRLQWFLLQEAARDYERMLGVLHALTMERPEREDRPTHRLERPLVPEVPLADLAAVDQGHYRIASRDEPAAYDNELPPQAVQLASFRIGKRPVTNAEYLAFLEAGAMGRTRIGTRKGVAGVPFRVQTPPEGTRAARSMDSTAVGRSRTYRLCAQTPTAWESWNPPMVLRWAARRPPQPAHDCRLGATIAQINRTERNKTS